MQFYSFIFVLALLASAIAQVDTLSKDESGKSLANNADTTTDAALIDAVDNLKVENHIVPLISSTAIDVIAYVKVKQNITGISASSWKSCEMADDYFSQTIFELISSDNGATSLVNYVNNINEEDIATGIMLKYDLVFYYTTFSMNDDALDTTYDAIKYYLNSTIVLTNNMSSYFSSLCSKTSCTSLGNSVMTPSFSISGPYDISTPSPTIIPTNLRQSSYSTNGGRLAVVLVLLLGFMIGSIVFSFCRYAKKHNKKMTAFDKWNNYTQNKSLTVEQANTVSESRRSANINLGDTFSPMMKKVDVFPPSMVDSPSDSSSNSLKENKAARLGSIFVQNPMSAKRMSTMPMGSSGKGNGSSSQENSPQVSRRKSVSFNASLEIPGNTESVDPIATLQAPPAVSPILRRQSLIGVSSPPQPSTEVTSDTTTTNDRSANSAMNMHNMARRRSNEMIGHLKSPTSSASNIITTETTTLPPVSPRLSRRQVADKDEEGL